MKIKWSMYEHPVGQNSLHRLYRHSFKHVTMQLQQSAFHFPPVSYI